MRPNALFRALSSFEKGVASRKVRWIYGLACGRRRTDWYAALVFLVPCSLCFTVFMWPLVLPSDLIEGVYRQTATSARTCAVAWKNDDERQGMRPSRVTLIARLLPVSG